MENSIVITGASRGIGERTAIRLAEQGYNLILWARDQDDLSRVAGKCKQYGVNIRIETVDISDPDSVMSNGAKSLEGINTILGVVVNAGVGVWGSIGELSIENWRKTISTNLDGAFYTLQLCLPKIHSKNGGQIVVAGSDSAIYPYATRGAYCASKAGLASLIEVLRRETRGRGVRVTHLVMSRVDSYFRGKEPGARPEGLSIEDVAEVTAWLFKMNKSIEVREIHLSAMTSEFGLFPEKCLENDGV